MKPFAILSALLLCLLAGLALAQNATPVQPVRTNAPVPAQRIAPVQPTAPVTTAPVAEELTVDTDVVDPQGTIDRLRAQNRTLRQENKRLKDDIARLDARITAFTTLGGSEVRAYCEAKDTSRNTAGASESCGNFACNQVSGLCHTSCTLTSHCSTGACFNGQCLTEAPGNDD